MAIQPILQNGEPLLRETAKPVPPELFGSKELSAMLKDMTDSLDKELDGVALAAPQIGIPYRIFIVRHDRTVVPEEVDEDMPDEDLAQDKTRGVVADSKKVPETIPTPEPVVGVFINPSFVKSSRRRTEMWEGCLSVRGFYGYALRHERATVRAQDEKGTWFERGAGGLLAEIFQHEIDHLDGILFIDHAEGIVSVKEMPEEKHAEKSDDEALEHDT